MSSAANDRRPLVHGYLCMEEPDEAQIAVWCKDITAFCMDSGYQLGQMFVDRGISDSTFARSGFVELLAALKLSEAHAAVVPTLAHLSTDDVVRNALTRLVQQTNSRLLVVELANSSLPAIDVRTDTSTDS